ncbi:MAG: hypothetical protein OXQ94_16890 [Gemmatimonadota bacterium]|nr:hypothetical protein [Gemmatimonadota bacterium]
MTMTRVATPETEATLLEYAQSTSAARLEWLARGWKRLSRDGELAAEEVRRQSRTFSVAIDADGMYVVRGAARTGGRRRADERGDIAAHGVRRRPPLRRLGGPAVAGGGGVIRRPPVAAAKPGTRACRNGTGHRRNSCRPPKQVRRLARDGAAGAINRSAPSARARSASVS